MPTKSKNPEKSLGSSDGSQESQTTQLRVMIEEDPYGNLEVMHECVIKGTTTVVPMRPSHLAGQLMAAAYVIQAKTYKKLALTSDEKMPGSKKE
jgi:hypothetical protein